MVVRPEGSYSSDNNGIGGRSRITPFNFVATMSALAAVLGVLFSLYQLVVDERNERNKADEKLEKRFDGDIGQLRMQIQRNEGWIWELRDKDDKWMERN